MVPMKKAQADGVKGMSYVPAFGIGVAMCSAAIAVVSFTARGGIPPLHFKDTFPAGLVVGLFWNIANGRG